MKAWLAVAAICLSTGMAAGQPQPADQAALAASQEALSAIDAERLRTDRAYAEELLDHVTRLAPTVEGNPELRNFLQRVRLFALTTLERPTEIAPILDDLIARRPRAASEYIVAIYAGRIIDHARVVALVETASRSVPGVGWAELREGLGRDNMYALLHQLDTGGRRDLRVRLARALFSIGWPGDGVAGSADFLRTILIDDHLTQGDTATAAEIASGLTTTRNVLALIVRPRYDAVLAPGRDRIEFLREAVAAEDQATLRGIQGTAPGVRLLLERAYFLRGVGRNEDTLALLRPHLSDVAATIAASDEGMWLINEAAYANIALGRPDAAVALMRELIRLPIAENIGLVGPSINFAAMLFETGHPAEGLTHARRLEAEGSQYTNDYGKMWIASAITCALARLDRGAEAGEQIERLRAHAEVNPAALTQAYLCLGRDDDAAALMIERLGRDDPTPAILALQDYERSRGPAQTGDLYDRLVALRERPDVRAALERVGRVLSLPLARSYWGNF